MGSPPATSRTCACGRRPTSPARSRSRRRSDGPARSSAWASTTTTTAASRTSSPLPTRCCSASSRTPSRIPGAPVTRPAATEQLDLECELAVVIGRRASRIGPAEASEVDLRLHDPQRRHDARPPARGPPVAAGQGQRRLRADGPGGRHPRRARRPRLAGDRLVGERRDLAGLDHGRDDLRRLHPRGVCVANDHVGAGRRHRHRHARGRRPLPPAASLPDRWRRHALRDRGDRRDREPGRGRAAAHRGPRRGRGLGSVAAPAR